MKTQALRLTRIPRVWYRIKDFQDSRVLDCTPNKVISQRWYLNTCCCTTNIVVHSSLVYTLACAQDKILPTFICCTSTSIRFSYFPPSQGKFSSFTLIMEVIKNLSYSTIWYSSSKCVSGSFMCDVLYEKTNTLLMNIISILQSNKLVIPMKFEHPKLRDQRHLMFNIEGDQTLIISIFTVYPTLVRDSGPSHFETHTFPLSLNLQHFC